MSKLHSVTTLNKRLVLQNRNSFSSTTGGHLSSRCSIFSSARRCVTPVRLSVCPPFSPGRLPSFRQASVFASVLPFICLPVCLPTRRPLHQRHFLSVCLSFRPSFSPSSSASLGSFHISAMSPAFKSTQTKGERDQTRTPTK